MKQRELRFRVWGIDNNGKFKMFDTFDFYDPDCGTVAEDSVVMQYTGLKDKHGKEIYEGDLVLANHYTTPFEVRFILGCFVLYGSFCDTCEPVPNKKAEVIGNIYENPELLVKAGT